MKICHHKTVMTAIKSKFFAAILAIIFCLTTSALAQPNTPPPEITLSDLETVNIAIISKEKMTLTLYNAKGEIHAQYPIATGKNVGQKLQRGDMKTPEGFFVISQIQNSSLWEYDFGDGKGAIKGAYGPWFIRLHTPGHIGIGIHGTHDEKSIGTRVSEGCIRMKNADLSDFVKKIKVGDFVMILADLD